MYNIRKKLWILMLAFFVAAIPVSHFSKKKSDDAVMASSEYTQLQQETEAIPIWTDTNERFVAHRGYSGYAPENSIPAFELAGKMGFWGIETDISETIDGAFICMHDESLDRTTDGEGDVTGYLFDQLEEYEIDTGNYYRTTENLKIPTLEEYLEVCREYGCVAIVEIKEITNYNALLQIIDDYGMTDRCVITGSEIEHLAAVHSINPQIPVMVIGYYPDSYAVALGKIADIPENRGVLYNYPQVTREVVEMLHSQNVLCAVWSIDETDKAREFIDYGVDFIVTNEIPARLESMINENE